MMGQSPITTPAAVCLDTSGATVWAKDGDNTTREIASVTKAFTAYYGLQATTSSITDLDATRTFYAGGAAYNPAALSQGDVVTVRDIYYATMLVSDNRAADNIGFAAINDPAPHNSHLSDIVSDMQGWYETTFGWSGFTMDSLSGLGDTFVSARMIAELGLAISTNQPWLLGVMGTAQHTATVTGPNPRSITYDYMGGPVKAAVEAGSGTFLGSKGGSALNGGVWTYSQIIIWADPGGARHSIGLVAATSTAQRDADITTIVSDVIADNGGGDPDPSSGLMRTDSTPVALMRTDGTPVTDLGPA